MAVSAKAYSLATKLQDGLSKRFATVSAVATDPADSCPYIVVGSAAIGSQSAIVKIIADQPLGVDSLGMTPLAFSPHRVQVILETSSVSAVALMTEANKLPLLGEIELLGATTELYLCANGVAVSLAGIAVGNKVATFYPSLKYPLSGS